MPDAQAPNPNAPEAIDWQQLIQLALQIIASLKNKSAYAKAHGLADPAESALKFVDDYSAVHKAMAANP